MNSQHLRRYLFLSLVTILLWFISMRVGGADVSWSEIFSWVKHENLDSARFYILQDLRLPRTMACIFIGASLALAGALLQTLLHNPLAEPYTLGVAGGASLGAVIALLTGGRPVWLVLPMGAWLGSIANTGLLYLIQKNKSQRTEQDLILTGIMLSLFCGAVVVLIMSLLDPNRLQTAIYWMMGQLGTPRDTWWPVLAVAFIIIFSSAFYFHPQLDRMLLGDEIALSLGVPLPALRWSIVVSALILTCLSVSVAGLIGFVGLVSSHVAFLLIRSMRHKQILPTACFIGAQFLLTADILARWLGRSREIPAGSFVALLGVPVFIFLLTRFQHARRA